MNQLFYDSDPFKSGYGTWYKIDIDIDWTSNPPGLIFTKKKQTWNKYKIIIIIIIIISVIMVHWWYTNK